jgi:hypothetical protein
MVCLGEPFNSGGGSRVDIFRRPNDTFESEATHSLPPETPSMARPCFIARNEPYCWRTAACPVDFDCQNRIAPAAEGSNPGALTDRFDLVNRLPTTLSRPGKQSVQQ